MYFPGQFSISSCAIFHPPKLQVFFSPECLCPRQAQICPNRIKTYTRSRSKSGFHLEAWPPQAAHLPSNNNRTKRLRNAEVFPAASIRVAFRWAKWPSRFLVTTLQHIESEMISSERTQLHTNDTFLARFAHIETERQITASKVWKSLDNVIYFR